MGMARILIGSILAPIAAITGYFAFWTGSDALYRSGSEGWVIPPDPVSIGFAALGLLLLATAGLMASLSSVGVIVVGVVHLVAWALCGMLPTTVPIAAISELGRANEAVGNGLLFSLYTGVGPLVGVLFLGSGIAIAARGGRVAGALSRGLTIVVALVAGLPGLYLAIASGAVVYRERLQEMSSAPNWPAIGVLAIGLGLFAVAVGTLRWSAGGVLVLGILLLAFAAGLLFFPRLFVLVSITGNFARGLQLASANLNLLLIGVLLVVAALASVIRARRLRYIGPLRGDSAYV